MISLKQVISQFQAFATAHKQVGKFGYEFKEQMGNLATVDEQYPYFFVVPMGATTLQNVVEFELDVYCVDRLQKDRTNTNFIVSDTQLILTDFTVWLEDGDHSIEVERIYPMTPVNNDLLDYVSGWFVRVRVQVERVSLCEVPMDGITPGEDGCADAIYNIYDTDGTLLYTGVVASGGEVDVTITDSTAVLKDTSGTILSTTSILAEGSEDIVAPDATYSITDDSANVLYSGSVVSGGSLSQVVADSTVTITDDSANVLHTVSVNAEGTATQIIADSTVTIKDDSNNTLYTVSVNAEGSANQVVSDSTVANSDSSYTASVNAEGSLVLPDSTVNVNSVNEGSVVSVKTIDINVTDGTDPVTPDAVSVVGNTVTIEVTTGSALDADAEAFLLATSITDATITTAVNDLVVGLKTNYLWNKMRALYPFVGGTATTHKFNLKDPRDLDAAYRLTFFGGITHSSTGADPNGTTGYANTHLSASTIGVSSIHMAFYSRQNTHAGAGTAIDIGTGTGSGNQVLLSCGVSNNNSPASYFAAVPNISTGSADGFFVGSFTGDLVVGSQNRLYKNGSTLATVFASLAASNQLPFYLFAANVSGANFFCNRECAFASIGFGLSDADVTALNTLVQAFNTTLSRNV